MNGIRPSALAGASTALSTKKGSSYWRAGKFALAMVGVAMVSPLWRGGAPSKPDLLHPVTASSTDTDTFLKQQQGIPLKPLNQNGTNACGTTALAMALNSLAAISRQDPDYQPLRHGDLDPGNRELDAFSAPNMLVRVAEEHGATAQMINNSTYEDIEGHISKGHPVLALTSESRSRLMGALHYVVIFKVDGHPDPMRRTVTYANPATGKIETMNYRQFSEEKASHLAVGKYLPTGFNRFIIALSAQKDLEGHRGVPATNLVATGMSNLLNNVGMFSRTTQDKLVEPIYALVRSRPENPQPVAQSDEHVIGHLASR